MRVGPRGQSAQTKPDVNRRGAAALRLRAVLALCGAWACSASIPVWADGPSSSLPDAIVCATADQASSGNALDESIKAGLEQLRVVSVTKRPGLDLVSLQLALDCVGETPKCLKAVAAQANVDVLIAPALEQQGAELIVSVLRYDARRHQLRRAIRRQQGAELDTETLQLVPGMLRELFGLPEPKADPSRPALSSGGEGAPEAAVAAVDGPKARSNDLPIAPFVLGGTGALILGGGLISGLIMQNTNDEYHEQLPVDDRASARSARDTMSQGKTEETVANVLLVVGGTALAVAGVWLAIELVQPERADSGEQTALLPLLTPDGAGLALVHRGSAL